MSDVVVTVPKAVWEAWLNEGDLPGEPASGQEWGFYTFGARPEVGAGERVYVIAHGKLRGYAPLTRLAFRPQRGALGQVVLCRAAGAVPLTVPDAITGFRGWRYRWWERRVEVPFPDWRTP